jgi:hypothetical protein
MSQEDPRLEPRLQRLLQALDEGEERQARLVEEWARRTGKLPSRKQQRRWERKRQRALRQSEGESRDPNKGMLYAAIALFLCLMALARFPQFWWMLFIVLGLGKKALFHLSSGGDEDVKPAQKAQSASEVRAVSMPTPSGDTRAQRVDLLCARLRQSFQNGPAVLLEVVQQPERTVEALQRGCHELLRREAELRALHSPEDVRRLEAERVALAARVDKEQDTVARERLTAALALLDAQRAQRRELGTAADRLEAEYTRLYYTLENLHAQVLRARSADALAAESSAAELRQSLQRLGDEVDAVSEALEEVHRAELPPISEPPPDDAGGPGGSRTRERG